MPVTMIDNGMPVACINAGSLGRTGYESRDELNGDTQLKERLEEIRLAIGGMMNLGDVADKTVPKMTLVAPPQAGGAVCTRSFIPHDCHAAIGVFAAVSVATACAVEGSVAAEVAQLPEGSPKLMSVEHPTGEFSVELEMEGSPAGPVIKRAALLRTARRLFEGSVLIPKSVGTDINPGRWPPNNQEEATNDRVCAGYPGAAPGPRKPGFEVPAKACDTHCHVFGPGALFPYAPKRSYTPPDASKADLKALHDHLGIERCVIVQASCHGTDNSAMIDAITTSNGRYKASAWSMTMSRTRSWPT